jgi:hypothetical protein
MPPPSVDILFGDIGTRVVRDGTVVRVEVREHRWPAVPVLVLAVGGFLTCVAFGYGWYQDLRVYWNIVNFIIGLFAMPLGFFAIGVMGWASLGHLYPRRLMIDVEKGTCRLTHLPGLSRTFSLTRVEAIELGVSKPVLSNMGCWVGLALVGQKRRVVVKRMPSLDRPRLWRKENPEVLLAQLRPLAEALAKLLDKPVRAAPAGARI